MLRSLPSRSTATAAGLSLACVLGLVLCPFAGAQRVMSSLPATPPTSAAGAQNAVQMAPLSATPTTSRAHRAEVTYASGLISINANNSSLNQILREIARLTGMKITGGVNEDRVFGHYGPAAPEVILSTLIDSNVTNMVLRETALNEPRELILTPRNGGASPPNPNAPGFDDDRSNAPEPENPGREEVAQPTERQAATPPPAINPASGPRSVPPPANNVLGNPNNVSPTASTLPVTNSVPLDTLPTPSTTTQTIPGIVDAPNPGTVNPVTVTSADTNTNGAATPEDIYKKLLQMRQQQQKTSTTPPQ